MRACEKNLLRSGSRVPAVLGDPRLWRCGRALPIEPETIPSGFAEIDALLSGGGWPRGALVEILSDMEGIGALRLVIPALAHLSQTEKWLAWIAPPHLPYGPALAAHGLALARLLLVWGIESPRERFWALEESLRAGACSAVLAWPRGLDGRGLRRLQLAAEAGRSLGLLFRPLAARCEASSAALRLMLEPHGPLAAVSILKRRGGAGARPVYLDLRDPEHSRFIHKF